MTATVTIDPGSPVPPFEQLRIQLDRQIRSGTLPAGSRLPTVRQLAADLAVAKNTVVRAYRALEHEGLVAGDRRRGTIVLPRATTPLERDRIIAEAAQRLVDDVGALSASTDEVVAAVLRALAAES